MVQSRKKLKSSSRTCWKMWAPPQRKCITSHINQKDTLKKCFFVFFFSHEKLNSCRKWNFTLPEHKTWIAHFEGWHMAVCLALQSQRDFSRAIWLNQEGQRARVDRRQLQLMINSWCIMYSEKLPTLHSHYKGEGCQEIHWCFLLLQWENKDARQSTVSSA